jgi:hypothetical protein
MKGEDKLLPNDIESVGEKRKRDEKADAKGINNLEEEKEP